ncbi:MAG: hypothetical protein HYZ28_01075 [Myxococcales bacterium]|nr:hypothetical protein [Myxococcales bacterium]
MEEGAARILRTLDRHLTAPASIRLLGGAALVLGYRMQRSTEDADLLLDDAEARFLAEERDFGAALETTNEELQADGLYISHLWGPEQQVLTPSWRQGCRRVDLPGLRFLSVEVLGPLDLIASKLCRADEGDLEDIRYLMKVERLASKDVREALAAAIVPPEFAEVYPENRAKVERLLAELD